MKMIEFINFYNFYHPGAKVIIKSIKSYRDYNMFPPTEAKIYILWNLMGIICDNAVTKKDSRRPLKVIKIMEKRNYLPKLVFGTV